MTTFILFGAGLALVVYLLSTAGVAPTPTARLDPSGIRLEDGYRSLITFASDTNVELWERTVTPPGLDGGDAVDTTTMHNDTWRSMAPRSLITMTDSTFTAGYDPIMYTALLALLNVETTITITFPDGSTLAFYGFLRSVQPNELAEGTFPEVTCTITPTNADPTTGAEESPVLTSVAGT